MSTSIEWTATVHPDGTVTPGSTWNPVTGCSKVSPGCAHCYAETNANRLWASQYPPIPIMRSVEQPGGGTRDQYDGQRPRVFTDVQCHEDRLDQPLRWKKPRKVFVNSMSDLFHEDVPDAFIDRVFAVMALAPQHTFQILTKRAERMRAYLGGEGPMKLGAQFAPLLPLPNVWLGVSVENQHFADERIPLLLQTPAAVRFISAEPLLGATDVSNWVGRRQCGACADLPCNCSTGFSRGLDWVIVGGESGAGARPFDVAWARSIVKQCQAAGVPVFVKQLGAKPTCDGTGEAIAVFGTRDRKGGDMAEWPSDLRVREFPRCI